MIVALHVLRYLYDDEKSYNYFFQTLILYEWTKKNSLITVLFNHKLIDMNFQKKEISLEKRENGEKILVIVKADKVIAADGLYSMVRR